MSRDVVLESAALRVTIRPQVGGTITGIRHKASGLQVLGNVPWRPVEEPLESGAAPDEPAWLTRYTGGWPLLFPNGGDACTVDGVFHGFHGEASISPWDAMVYGNAIRLERWMTTVPVHMTRTISVDGSVVRVQESAVNESATPVAVMWGHHPTFGSDLLGGEFEITTGARDVTVDRAYDPPMNPLRPGVTGRWPVVRGKQGDVDLSRPMSTAIEGRMSSLAYLDGFESAWIAIRRLDDAIAVILSWDAAIFPTAWLWFELAGTPDAPWEGRTRLVGLEPNTTPLAYGLAEAARQRVRLLTLEPAKPVQAEVRLRVFKPVGTVSGNAIDGGT
jgi:hypothetical protein